VVGPALPLAVARQLVGKARPAALGPVPAVVGVTAVVPGEGRALVLQQAAAGSPVAPEVFPAVRVAGVAVRPQVPSVAVVASSVAASRASSADRSSTTCRRRPLAASRPPAVTARPSGCRAALR